MTLTSIFAVIIWFGGIFLIGYYFARKEAAEAKVADLTESKGTKAMANVFAWLEHAGQKVIQVVEQIPSAAVTVAKLLATGQQVAPGLKTAITLLVEDAEAISVPVLTVIATKGASWTEDAATVAAVEKLAQDFVSTILPQIETDAKALAADLK